MGDKRVICANGHYYDGSKYSKCPHCAEGLARVEPSFFSTANTQKKDMNEEGKKTGKKSFFSRKKVDVRRSDQNVVPVSKKEMVETSVNDENQDNHDLTRGLQTLERRDESVKMEMPHTASGGVINKVSDVTEQRKQQEVKKVIEEAKTEPQVMAQKVSQEKMDLSEAFEQATMPQKKQIDKDKTVSFFSTGGKTEPPVGYLICVAGEDFGCGFPLKSGNNAIGRGQSMDVVVMDPKVSREKQAFVMYEPKNRQFFVRPGEGTGLCYLNGEIVLSPMPIHQFDKLGVGDTELMLIAVCCEQFGWEDYEKTGE